MEEDRYRSLKDSISCLRESGARIDFNYGLVLQDQESWQVSFDLQPGNATRYEIVLSSLPGPEILVVVFIGSVSGTAWRMPTTIGTPAVSYVAEKLQLREGDAAAIHHLLKCLLGDASPTGFLQS